LHTNKQKTYFVVGAAIAHYEPIFWQPKVFNIKTKENDRTNSTDHLTTTSRSYA
jgi:hypothetical protein